MEENLNVDVEIAAVKGAPPIRFVHRKGLDSPDRHVLHLNNHIEIYVYVSGNHHYIVENALYELARGDVVVINPREVHKALPLSECAYERFYLLVDEHALAALAHDPLAQILNKPAHTGNRISFDESTREEVLRMLYAISDCFRDGRNDQFRAFGYFLRILDEIDHQLKLAQPPKEHFTQAPELLKKILTYVAEHYVQIQSVTEISFALGLSPQYLSSYFAKQVGTPLKTYIQAKRIALAKDLLDNGADVTRACYECGFNDCSYFIRIFKAYVGITPLAYKQKAPHAHV